MYVVHLFFYAVGDIAAPMPVSLQVYSLNDMDLECGTFEVTMSR